MRPFEALEDRRLFSVIAHYYNDGFWGNGDGNAGRPTAPTIDNGGVLKFDRQTISVARAGDVQTTVANIDFDWGGGSPDPAIRTDNHSTLFVGKLVAPTAGEYEILGYGDDDAHVFVDGQLVSSDPLGHGQTDPRSAAAVGRGGGAKKVTLTAGNHELVVLHAEQGGGSGVRLRWVTPGGDTAAPVVVPAENLLADVTPVTAPTGLSRDASEAYGVKINFTDTSNTELRYDLQRRAGTAGEWTTVATGHINDNSITDYSAKFGTAYQYRVVAWNLQGTAASADGQIVSLTPQLPAAVPGAQGYYFNHQWWKANQPTANNGTDVAVGYNPDFSENVGDIVEDYGDGAAANGSPGSPEPGVIRNDNHSTVFVGQLRAPVTGTYEILGFTDDDSYVFVDGQLTSADPGGHGVPTLVTDINIRNPITLTAGQTYDFVLVHSEGGGGSAVNLRWLTPTMVEQGITVHEAVPTDAFVSNQNSTPLAPTNLVGTTTDVTVARLTWTDNSKSEVRYTLERSTSADFSNATRTLLPINATSYLDTTLARGTTYFYRLTAENFTGTGSATTTFSTPGTSPAPAAPSGLAAYNVGDRNYISFTDNSVNESGFVIERRLASGGAFAPITASPIPGTGPNVSGGTINYVDAENVVSGQTYVYRVRSVNVDNAESANSNESTTTVQGLRATIYDSTGLFGARNFYDNPAPGVDPIVRQDPNVDIDFGTGSPDARVDGDFFTVVWEGYFTPEVTGAYTFYGESDDGIRVFVDGNLVVDQWVDRGVTETAGTPVDLTAGQPVEIRVQYYENGGGALARVRYEAPGVAKQIVPIGRLTPANASNPLRAPTNVQAASNLGTGINVTWVDNSASETGFRIERSTDAQTYSTLATLPANQSGYVDTNNIDPSFASAYYYRVVALGAGGAEAASAATSGTYPAEEVMGAFNYPNIAAEQSRFRVNGAGDPGFGTWVDTNGDGTADRLRLTNNVNNQWGSVFLQTPVVVNNGFTSSFDFVVGGPGAQSANPADGFTWVLQAATANNAPVRTAAIGGGGGGMGYAGIGNSVALKFDIYNNLNQTGLYLNGNAISDDPADTRNRVIPAEFDINSGMPLRVTIGYDPTTKVLTQTIDDIANPATAPFATSYVVDLAATLGQGNAFVGFTGATGGENARQEILSFAFDPTAPVAGATVSEVYVRGSSWLGQDNNAGTTNFMEYLEQKGLGDDVMGYRLFGPGRAAPAANPEDTIPWINVDQIVVRYSSVPTGAGIPTPGTLSVAGLNPTLSAYTVTGVAQVPGDPTAYVLTLSKPLGGGDPVAGTAPSEDENGDRITLGIPGAGPAGSNFSLTMNVLQGDTDHLGETSVSHAVLARDFAEVKKKFFKDTTTAVEGTDAGAELASATKDLFSSSAIL